jgi:F0F1-type ATP synthase assembly protein I
MATRLHYALTAFLMVPLAAMQQGTSSPPNSNRGTVCEMNPNDNRHERYRQIRQVGTLAMIPMIMLASPLIGYVLGRLIDDLLHTGPWFQLIMLFVGLGGGMHQTYILIKKTSANK